MPPVSSPPGCRFAEAGSQAGVGEQCGCHQVKGEPLGQVGGPGQLETLEIPLVGLEGRIKLCTEGPHSVQAEMETFSLFRVSENI